MNKATQILEQTSLDRSTLSARLYSMLEHKVLTGLLPPGTPLSEESIAKTYNVSRSPAREALFDLERAGFAVRDGVRDRMIAIPTRAMIAERYDAWWIVDIGRTYLASLEATAEEITELRGYLDRAERALKVKDPKRYRAASQKFHDKIRQGCRNAYVIQAGNNSNLTLRWFEMLYDSAPEVSAETLVEHRRILDAYERKHIGDIAESMRVHAARQRERILNGFDALVEEQSVVEATEQTSRTSPSRSAARVRRNDRVATNRGEN